VSNEGDGIALTNMAHPDTERRKRLFGMISARLGEGFTPATSGLVDDIILYMDSLYVADISEDALETIEIEVADR